MTPLAAVGLRCEQRHARPSALKHAAASRSSARQTSRRPSRVGMGTFVQFQFLYVISFHVLEISPSIFLSYQLLLCCLEFRIIRVLSYQPLRVLDLLVPTQENNKNL